MGAMGPRRHAYTPRLGALANVGLNLTIAAIGRGLAVIPSWQTCRACRVAVFLRRSQVNPSALESIAIGRRISLPGSIVNDY